MDERIEAWPALSQEFCQHGFTLRARGVDVAADRETALARLKANHDESRRQLGLAGKRMITAEQVHGRDLAIVDSSSPAVRLSVDGLLTADVSVCLGIYVADCCPLFLFDPVRRVAGLIHAGRKGTEINIAGAAITRMACEFGSRPQDIVAQLGPCIRLPCYDVDFASQIVRQCSDVGVVQVYDSGTCTACHPERYYSYRAEKGKTGRMLALLAIR